MSNRYVWLKNNLALNVTGQLLAGQWFSAAAYPSGTLHIGESVHASGNKVELNESATKTINSGASSTIASENYGYISTDSGSHYPSNADLWHNNTNVNANILSSSQGWQLTSGTLDIIRGWKKGSNTGTISNASSSTYPQDGVSGNYWYTLQGSDNIDAASVTYSNQAPMGGQPITINVTAGSGNVYGGTVRYTYQVQLNNGSWTTIATNSTATSQEYTIPAGTTSFAARVLASDTWGFSSSTYTTGATLTVTNNLPPTAPASITIGTVLGGETCTITWEAATDSDGTVVSYQLERQTDNGDTWTQIYSGPNLTYDDTINSDWATVNYRVKATDDDGASGPYTTGTMQTVNAGWLYFSGPAADMGDKPAPFDFIFAIGSTTAGTTDISVEVVLDDETVYTGTPDAAEQVTIPVDTRLMYEGEHTFVVTAEKENLLGLTQVCTFTVPAVSLPDGGAMVQLYNDEGRAVFPLTLGRAVIGQNSESVNRQLDRYFSGTYTGTGTSGSGNPTQLRLSFTPRFLSVYSNASTPATGLWIRTADADTQAQGVMQTTGGTATVQWDAENMILSWYGSSAAVQLNTSGVEYGYVVTG